MAWNVVVAGGGFGGAAAARELERLMPKQSARLSLVNETNFSLYTPFLPEAAAGTLEPRHVVTPLRELLKRTYLRLGEIVAHDPEAKTLQLRKKFGGTEELGYDQLLLALGSVSRTLPVPGLAEHAVGFKGLADAIYLRNHVVETLEEANATEDPARRERLLSYVFVGGGYAGLEALAELQDFAADAMDAYPRARLHGMRWVLVEASDRVLPEIDRHLPDYALREPRARGIDIRLNTTLEEVTADTARLSSGEVLPTETVVWTAGVAPQPILKELSLHGMRWVLVEASDRVLPEIDRQLADYALRELRGRGIDIRLNTTLEEVTADTARLSSGEVLPTETVVWTAGVAPQPILKELSLPLDERGRVPVDQYLRVQGLDSVWAIGDCAAAPDPRGGTCPPTAQHAVRQGPVAARNIAAELGIGTPAPFDFKSYASFVNLGRYKAVGRIGDRTFRGFPAWWLARSYHMSQIPGTARKVRAVLDWTAGLPFSRDISEVGTIGHPKRLG